VPAPAASGDIYHLGALFEGTHSEAFSINNSGQVTGVAQIHADGSYFNAAFRYDGIPGAGGVMVDLHEVYAGLNSINDSGQVCGVTGPRAGEDPEDRRVVGYRLTGTPGAGGVRENLGYVGAAAINDAGTIAGAYSADAGSGLVLAVRYTGSFDTGGVIEDLGVLGTGDQSIGFAINNAGQVAGFSTTTPGNAAAAHAFLYTGTPGAGGAMADLGTLGTGTNSGAQASITAGEYT
jgi:probable HAF family extracellular repeat protein